MVILHHPSEVVYLLFYDVSLGHKREVFRLIGFDDLIVKLMYQYLKFFDFAKGVRRELFSALLKVVGIFHDVFGIVTYALYVPYGTEGRVR